MNVIVKLSAPEYYDSATHALIKVTPELVEHLSRTLDFVKKVREMSHADHLVTAVQFDDATPGFINFCGDNLGSMSEEEFDNHMDYGCLLLNEDIKAEFISMLPITLHVSGDNFYWVGYDKYLGVGGRCETYEMRRADLEEWKAELEKVAV